MRVPCIPFHFLQCQVVMSSIWASMMTVLELHSEADEFFFFHIQVNPLKGFSDISKTTWAWGVKNWIFSVSRNVPNLKYHYILWEVSFGFDYELNFNCLTMKFHKCRHTNMGRETTCEIFHDDGLYRCWQNPYSHSVNYIW